MKIETKENILGIIVVLSLASLILLSIKSITGFSILEDKVAVNISASVSFFILLICSVWLINIRKKRKKYK